MALLLHGLSLLALLSGLTAQSPSKATVYRQPVRVPRCCPDGMALSGLDGCDNQQTGLFAPPVHFNSTNVVAVNVPKEPPVTIACEASGGVVTPALVGGASAAIFHQGPGLSPQLVYRPEDQEFPIVVDTFCVGFLESNGHYLAKFCYDKDAVQGPQCDTMYCMRKCCPDGEDLSGVSCRPSTLPPFEPVFASPDKSWAHLRPHADLGRIHGFPRCNPAVFDEFTLDPKGDLHLYQGQPLLHTRYCIDRQITSDGDARPIALACLEKPPTGADCRWKSILDSVLMSISCLFLFVTAVVYLSVPRLRPSLSRWSLVAFVLSLCLCFVTFIVLKTNPSLGDSHICKFTAVAALVFTLASFFWFNILCFANWAEIRNNHQEEPSTLCFVGVSAYGCLGPLLVALTAYVLDATKANVVRPHFGETNCWFIDKSSRWAYQYGIMLALLVVDVALCVWSAVILARRRQRSAAPKQELRFFWLIFIMGASWILELITWHVGARCQAWATVIDVIISLQGFYIFLVCVYFKQDLKFRGRWWTLAPTEDEAPSGRYTTSNVEMEPPKNGTN